MRFLPSLSLLSALLLAAPASAQATFALKGGLNVTTFSGDLTDGLDPRLGFVGGAALRLDVSPSLALQAEALYSQKGAEDGGRFDPGTYQIDYLDVPILLRAGLPVSRTADVGLYAGPTIGIPLSGRFDSADADVLDIDYGDDLGTDVGAAVGLDYWSGPVGIDLRYTAGLSDVFEGSRGLRDVRNQAVSITLGYRLGGGRYGRY